MTKPPRQPGRPTPTVVVAISDCQVSDDPRDILVTYSLGSCIGVAMHDPTAKVGGLLHCLLPLSNINPAMAATNCAMFVDTGVCHLIDSLLARGAQKHRLIVKAAGAADTLGAGDIFRIGSRNCTVLRKILWKNNRIIAAEDVGGTRARTMTLHIASGEVFVQTGREVTQL